VAELDGVLLGAEIGIMVDLAAQCILAVVAGVVGCWAGRRWVRVGFPLALLLAAAACGWTLYDCSEARESVRGRLDGRTPGQHLPRERGENHLAWVTRQGRLSVGIATATVAGAAVLYYFSGRHRRADVAAQGAAADGGGMTALPDG